MIGIVALVFGIVLGVIFHPSVPEFVQPYLPIAVVAALDAVFGGLRAYLDLAEDEGNAWGRLAESLARLGRVDEAADAYLTGIDQSLKHGHTGMADEFRAALEAL